MYLGPPTSIPEMTISALRRRKPSRPKQRSGVVRDLGLPVCAGHSRKTDGSVTASGEFLFSVVGKLSNSVGRARGRGEGVKKKKKKGGIRMTPQVPRRIRAGCKAHAWTMCLPSMHAVAGLETYSALGGGLQIILVCIRSICPRIINNVIITIRVQSIQIHTARLIISTISGPVSRLIFVVYSYSFTKAGHDSHARYTPRPRGIRTSEARYSGPQKTVTLEERGDGITCQVCLRGIREAESTKDPKTIHIQTENWHSY